ncbi:MAG: hypothetical protein KAR38_01755, partial [Calditrichia bacterium]|nr:hypothetical protein [Calditrichia bacterium]
GIRKFEIISQRSIGKIEFAKFSSHLFNQEKSHPTKTIFEYLHENSIILLHNREMIQNKMEDWKSLDFNEMEIFNPQIKSATVDEIEHKISSFNSISLVHTEMGNKTFHFPFQPPNNFQGSLKLLFNSLKDWKKNNGNLKNFVIYCETKEKKENLFNFIDEELGEEFIPRLITAPLSRGFSFNNHQYMFLTEHEIFNRVKTTTTIKKLQTAGAVIRKMKQMTPGDIVVHLEYGIGQYEGIEQLSIGNNPPKDVVKLIYYDNDSLYVSLDKINKIQKYTSTKENFSPQLSKLGSTEWTTKRKKTKKAIEKIAADLIQLYAVRMTQKGFQFSKDTLWQREMEASFSFEETPDQNKAINDVKKDMQKTQPMDRLICGDVGFGKTEVAIRAAFKAVQENKQVAVLAPT